MRFRNEYPHPLLQLRPMRHVADVSSLEARQDLLAATKALQQEKGSRQALDYLLRKLETELSNQRNEEYFAEALNFHLGLLASRAGRPEVMSEHLRLSHTMPAPELDLLFSDHVALSIVARQHQQHAIARGLPAILFACMPRSGSATLTHSLAQLLDVPVFQLSLGRSPDRFLVPSWLDMFLEGGALTQDHFNLNDFNRGVLGNRGKRDIFVTIRDPRAAARSNVYFEDHGAPDPSLVEGEILRQCLDRFIPWLQSWIDVANDPASPFRVHMIRFGDVVRDLPESLRSILRILQDGCPAIGPYAEAGHVDEVRIHFKRGDDEAWRSEVGEGTRARLWEGCTPEIRDLLRLRP